MSRTGEQLEVIAEINGRPDFGNWKFGITYAKKIPEFVYSRSRQALLMHRTGYVAYYWYTPIRGGNALGRLKNPRRIATTVCGQSLFLFGGRASMCSLPKPSAIPCGRCNGEMATFGRYGKKSLSKTVARVGLGCVEEAL